MLRARWNFEASMWFEEQTELSGGVRSKQVQVSVAVMLTPFFLLHRTCHASSAESRASAHKAWEGKCISYQSEAATVRSLQRACTKVLSDLPTSLDEDLSQLVGLASVGSLGESSTGPQHDESFMLALQWRIAYKRTLHKSLTYCSQWVEKLGAVVH